PNPPGSRRNKLQTEPSAPIRSLRGRDLYRRGRRQLLPALRASEGLRTMAESGSNHTRISRRWLQLSAAMFCLSGAACVNIGEHAPLVAAPGDSGSSGAPPADGGAGSSSAQAEFTIQDVQESFEGEKAVFTLYFDRNATLPAGKGLQDYCT